MNYKPGDKVKIISLEKVRSYPKGVGGWRKIDCCFWGEEMDFLAGTMRVIDEVGKMCYTVAGVNYTLSPEMIEGPADPVNKNNNNKMIPSNLIEIINGEPCVLAIIHDSHDKGLCFEYIKEHYFPLDETLFNDGDNVWVKCYENTDGAWIIDLDANNKATIYPEEQEELWNDVIRGWIMSPKKEHYSGELMDKYTITRKK